MNRSLPHTYSTVLLIPCGCPTSSSSSSAPHPQKNHFSCNDVQQPEYSSKILLYGIPTWLFTANAGYAPHDCISQSMDVSHGTDPGAARTRAHCDPRQPHVCQSEIQETTKFTDVLYEVCQNLGTKLTDVLYEVCQNLGPVADHLIKQKGIDKGKQRSKSFEVILGTVVKQLDNKGKGDCGISRSASKASKPFELYNQDQARRGVCSERV